MTGFSTTVISTPAPSRSMRTSENRPVANSDLDRLVDLAGVVGIADVELEIGAHGLGLDAPVARPRGCRGWRRSGLRQGCADYTTGSTTVSAQKRDHRSQDEVPAPRLAHPNVLAFFPSAFQFADPPPRPTRRRRMGASATPQLRNGPGTKVPSSPRLTGPKHHTRYNLFNRSVTTLGSGNITPTAQQNPAATMLSDSRHLR